MITRVLANDWKKQIDDAVNGGCDVIKLQCNGGEQWREKVRNPKLYELKTTGKYLPLVVETIKYIEDNYPKIYIQSGITGSTLTDMDFLKEWAKASVEAGAHRVSFSDSMGVGAPHTMQYLCEEIRSVIGGADLQVHCHNDYGMATANTIGAVAG